jgi:cytidylate kinase
MSKALTIAIDGPAASGKSTLAKTLAESLGYLYFDTGAMYRAVTLAALQQGVPIDSGVEMESLARRVHIDLRPASRADGRLYDVLLDGMDCTWAIRNQEVDANVSQVSAYAGVRTALTEQQRRIAERGGVVMAGRDIGTVVLPNADLKIFLNASLSERAKRRYTELMARGETADLQDVSASIEKRDQIDANRAVAPLRVAADAIVLESDGTPPGAVLENALRLVSQRLGQSA